MHLKFIQLLMLMALPIIIISSAKAAHAQVALPGSAETGRFEERYKRDEFTPQPEIIPTESAIISEAIPEAQNGFILNAVNIEGSSIYSDAQLEKITAEYIGKSVDLNVLQHLASRLTQLYRDDGYLLARAVIPAQEVEGGAVTITIIEGYVDNIHIDDPDNLLEKDHFSIFEKTIFKIKNLRPIHGPTLERYMLLLNEGQGLFVKSYLTESKSQKTGAIDIVLSVSEKPRYISAAYNNFGSRFVGPHQLEGIYATGNLFTPLDSLSLQTTFSYPFKDREIGFGALTYATPIHENGLEFIFSSSYSESRPGHTLEVLEVKGRSLSFEAGLNYPLIRSRAETLDIGATLASRRSSTEFLQEELIEDKIRSLELNARYKKLDQTNAINSISLALEQGLDILGATQTGSEKLSRAEGRSDFFKATIGAERQQEVADNVILTLGAEGQYAPHPLLSSEEFGYGGSQTGRAYDSSEILGDSGVAASAQIDYTGIEPIEDLHLKIIPFAFYDIGKTWNEDTGSKPESAASAGLGLDYNIANKASGAVQVAWPLTKSVDTPVMGGPDGPRILFNMSVQF